MRGNDKVSASAWNAALEEIERRFDNIEKRLEEISEKLNKKVSEGAWNRANEEILEKLKSKVSVSAWERSLEDMQKQFTELALNQLKILDERLDKTSSLVSEIISDLNEKVNVDLWKDIKAKVDALEKENKELKARVLAIEELIEDARISEKELKKLLESI